MMNDDPTRDDHAIIPRSPLKLNNNQMHPFCRIKQQEFIVPYRETKSNGNGKFELGSLVTPHGERYVAAFTSLDELRKGPYFNSKATLLSFSELKREVFNNPHALTGMAINPLSKILLLRQKQLTTIDLLTENFDIQRDENCWHDQLIKPKEEIPELIGALIVFCSGRKQVYEAYMLMIKEHSDIMEKLLFIIDFNGSESELFPALGDTISRHIEYGKAFELIKATYSLLCAAEETSGPIYQKF